jgi:hypothetical protein
METENLNQEVDVFSMSDDDFAAWEQGSSVQSTEESAAVADSSNIESEEQELVDDEYIDVPEEEDEIEEEFEEDTEVDTPELDTESDLDSTEEGDEELSDESTEESESDDVDYQAEFKKLIGSPIKANGMEITVDSVDDAIRLMQMGMGYSRKMEELKPARQVIAMLENNGLMDTEKLNYAIDLMNKNPQAISKLVAEAGIDKYELDEETSKDYKPTDYQVSEQEIALDNALKEISSTPTYARTVNVIGKEWDNASREIIKQHPEVIGLLNTHMSNGMFDTVQQEVEKRRMLGTLPSGISNIEAYKLVGDSLYASPQSQVTPDGQLQSQAKANVKQPIQKPSREAVVRQKKAAKSPRGKSPVTKQLDDVFNMSDDDFLKRYAGINN